MWFLVFQKTCVKYDFLFELNTYSGLKLILRPNHKLEYIIRLSEDYGNYNKLFKRAIKEIKKYRKIHK